jgi:hypothetical protein
MALMRGFAQQPGDPDEVEETMRDRLKRIFGD